MKTRKQYLDGEITFSEYYEQFVTGEVKANLLRYIGAKKILASEDKHFNDIPLKLWDDLPTTLGMSKALSDVGDYLTLSGKVCIYKTAAQQLLNNL